MQPIDLQVILLLIFLYLSAIIFNIVNIAFQQEMHDIQVEELIVSFIGLVVAIVGVFALFAVYFLDRRHKKQKACDTIILEIDHNKTIFTNPDYYKNVRRDNDIDYLSVKFSLSAYESIVYSGLYSYFDTDTQTALSRLYNRIKSFNETFSYLTQYSDLLNLFTRDDDPMTRTSLYEYTAKRYEITLTLLSKEIRTFLDATNILVEKEKQQKFVL